MSSRILTLAALLLLLLPAGCGQVPTAAPGQDIAAPTTAAYPPPPTVPTAIPEPTKTPVPPPTATPVPTPIQPTPYAPTEALPPDLPAVLYAVRRPGQAVQLWQLRYEQGQLREELWLDLDPAAAESQDDPRSRGVGYAGVARLIPSPDGRYVALTLESVEGRTSPTLIIGQDLKVYKPLIPSMDEPRQWLPIGLLAWLPGSDRMFVGDANGFVWGTIRADGTDFVGFPGQSVFVEFPGRFVLPSVLDAAALMDGETVLFSHIPIGSLWLGSIEVTNGKLTSFVLPETLLSSLKGRVRNLALSPDGRTCAFTAEHSVTDQGGGQIWLVGTDGSDFRPLGPANTYDYELAWSPDGQAIAFSRWDPYPDIQSPPPEPTVLSGSLRLIDIATGSERLLLSAEGRLAHWAPTWLPDGSGLLFLSDRGGLANLWFIRPDGTGLQQLTYQGGLTGEITLLEK